MIKNNYNVCDCRFTVKALGDFIDTFGREPKSNSMDDCSWVGKHIDSARSFDSGGIMQRVNGRTAIVNYWCCRRMGKIVPLGGGKVGIKPI